MGWSCTLNLLTYNTVGVGLRAVREKDIAAITLVSLYGFVLSLKIAFSFHTYIMSPQCLVLPFFYNNLAQPSKGRSGALSSPLLHVGSNGSICVIFVFKLIQICWQQYTLVKKCCINVLITSKFGRTTDNHWTRFVGYTCYANFIIIVGHIHP